MTWNDIEAAVGAEDQKFLVVNGTMQINRTVQVDPVALADAIRAFGIPKDLLIEDLRKKRTAVEWYNDPGYEDKVGRWTKKEPVEKESE